MGWLLELLLDGIREICSQFIVDMMELVTEMFTELLSCNLSLFEELFSVVSALYKNVIVPMGIAMLLVILVWQLFKSMFGKSVNGEEPVELLIRSAIALFFVVAAKPIVNYILKFAGTPYQWVVGTEIKVESFSGFVSALEGVTETLGVILIWIAQKVMKMGKAAALPDRCLCFMEQQIIYQKGRQCRKGAMRRRIRLWRMMG